MLFRVLLSLALGWSTLFAGAIAAAPAGSPIGPADGAAVAPPLRFDSAFAGYQPFAEPPPVAWREANEEVRKAGTRAMSREPGASSAAPASPKSEASEITVRKPASHPH